MNNKILKQIIEVGKQVQTSIFKNGQKGKESGSIFNEEQYRKTFKEQIPSFASYF